MTRVCATAAYASTLAAGPTANTAGRNTVASTRIVEATAKQHTSDDLFAERQVQKCGRTEPRILSDRQPHFLQRLVSLRFLFPMTIIEQPITVRTARAIKLSSELKKLATWADKRSGFPHCPETTISMMHARVEDIIDRVNRAGWKASANGPSEPRGKAVSKAEVSPRWALIGGWAGSKTLG